MDERDLSDFQQRQVRDLPHREELRAMGGELWPKARQGGPRLDGSSGDLGALSGKNVYATPESEMAWERSRTGKPA